MDEKSMLTVEVCFSPRLFADILTKEHYIVVLTDILRATTSICAAFENGAEAIIPVATLEEARRKKEEGYLVASELDGKKLDFADFGNSAFNFTREAVAGKTIVYCTTNGTKALDIARHAEKIAIGAFVNLSALTEWILQQKKNIVILCSGWKNKFCLEDSLFAGALAAKLLDSGLFSTRCDSVHAAVDLWNIAGSDLPGYIEKAAHRHRLRKLGLDDVLPYSLTPDSTKAVPVYEGSMIRNRAEEIEGKLKEPFRFFTEQFADARILRYQVPGFEQLDLRKKLLIYYLSQAALCGRDIIYDQNYKYNLLIRKTLEAVYHTCSGDRRSPRFMQFEVYLKRIWFSNGIHHHNSTGKFFPEFPQDYFEELIRHTDPSSLPLAPGQSVEEFIPEVSALIFDPSIAPKRVSLNADDDLVVNSASNFYEGVTQKEVEAFYDELKGREENTKQAGLVSFGLNSKVVRRDGRVTEDVYKLGGLYHKPIAGIIHWLEKAMDVTENVAQRHTIEKLISFYRTGNLQDWDEYSIAWVKDNESKVDFINGFIEVYGDPLAMKGSWESIVNFRDDEATRRTEILSSHAMYFEENSPVDPAFKKKEVRGVTAKVIVTAQLGGESHPTTPIGVNLPNANWIREQHGSKSVTMDNITYAYDQAARGNGFLEEFAASPEEVERVRKYGYLAGNLHTDLHECLGHGSGQLLPGVSADSLKNYHSAVEETRADLFALYYMMDPVMIELGLMPEQEVAKAEYDNYIRNGLMTQLVRVEFGKTIEQAHMRNRSLISHWLFEKGGNTGIIERFDKDGKTAFRINDYQGMRQLIGELLREVQRITSEGDYAAARELVETYGVQVDQALHREVLDRYARLNIAPYAGFINPVYTPVIEGETIVDVRIEYPDDFASQMLHYSDHFSFLEAR